METEQQRQPAGADFEHVPVLLEECLEGLAIRPDGTYLDGTAGGAGHSRAIASRLDSAAGGRLIALDQDPDAVAAARSRLAGLPAVVVQTNFRYAADALASLGVQALDGALLDLGVSSHQLDDAERGFSYRADAPLDMRMSQEGPTAADLVNTLSREELARILRDYGEEPYAWQIAGKIAEARAAAPIQTTLQLAGLVASAMPPAVRLRTKTPPGAAFRPCASRSTTSWTPWTRGWTPSSPPLPPAGGCASSPSTRWRTGWSRTSSAGGPPPVPARPSSLSVYAAAGPRQN